ncbi:hypothetical protein BDD14_4858 [Edaphobacter modestus]|uniref:Uncharacterized protein n=1 Tax=Edaphobacter modestus TaxID=388466 RepID=A0A4Q7Z113_9BACT|nr:hypothetical protein BDD14_4858 [Edaphobacter modestus]
MSLTKLVIAAAGVAIPAARACHFLPCRAGRTANCS